MGHGCDHRPIWVTEYTCLSSCHMGLCSLRPHQTSDRRGEWKKRDRNSQRTKGERAQRRAADILLHTAHWRNSVHLPVEIKHTKTQTQDEQRLRLSERARLVACTVTSVINVWWKSFVLGVKSCPMVYWEREKGCAVPFRIMSVLLLCHFIWAATNLKPNCIQEHWFKTQVCEYVLLFYVLSKTGY